MYSFCKSSKPNKKYDIYKDNKYLFSIGDSRYGQYYDLGGYFSDKDNLSHKKRNAYYSRHGDSQDKNSRKYWAHVLLWNQNDDLIANNIKCKYPDRYFKGLNTEQVIEQYKSIIQKKERPKFKNVNTKKSTWTQKFHLMFPNLKNYSDLDEIQKVTGIKKKYLQKVLNKGYAAYFNSGSRPSVTSHAWAFGRLYKFIILMILNKGKTLNFDTEIRDEILNN
jgi:hypothetical protein